MAINISNFKKIIQAKVYAPHFDIIRSQYGHNSFKLLDVGCGPHSVKLFKSIFPKIEYYGIDFNNSKISDSLKNEMHTYYEINLNDLDLEVIPDNYFDCLVCSHVIEHLNKSMDLIDILKKKVKKGGFIFIEFPGLKSTKLIPTKRLPFVRGTSNFYDDITHVNIYNRDEIAKKFTNDGFKIIKNSYRRNFSYLLLSPLILSFRFLSNGFVLNGSDLWDFTGFAEIVYVKKVE